MTRVFVGGTRPCFGVLQAKEIHKYEAFGWFFEQLGMIIFLRLLTHDVYALRAKIWIAGLCFVGI